MNVIINMMLSRNGVTVLPVSSTYDESGPKPSNAAITSAVKSPATDHQSALFSLSETANSLTFISDGIIYFCFSNLGFTNFIVTNPPIITSITVDASIK